VITGAPTRFRSQRIIALENNDIALDSARGRLYVSTPRQVVGWSNAIVAIEVATGDVAWALPMGREPRQLAISSDGHWLYAELPDEPSVARIDLNTRSVSLKVDLTPFGAPYGAGRPLLALPGGNGRTFLASTSNGTVVFDDDVARPQQGGGFSGLVVSGNPARYYAAGGDHSLFFLDIGATGIDQVSTGFYSGGFMGAIDQFNGRVFSTEGAAVDAATLRVVGTLPFATSVLVDPVPGRLFHTQDSTLRVYDVSTLQPIDSLNLGFYSGYSRRTLRFGSDGLIVHNEAYITIIRSDIVAP
jgi:hypothetical protein